MILLIMAIGHHFAVTSRPSPKTFPARRLFRVAPLAFSTRFRRSRLSGRLRRQDGTKGKMYRKMYRKASSNLGFSCFPFNPSTHPMSSLPNSPGCLTTLGVVGRCICPTKSSCTQRLRDTRAATASTESHYPRAMAWVFRRSVKRGQVGRQLERWKPGTGMAGKWGSSLAIKHGNAICPFT